MGQQKPNDAGGKQKKRNAKKETLIFKQEPRLVPLVSSFASPAIGTASLRDFAQRHSII
jgi:hypothetical protein